MKVTGGQTGQNLQRDVQDFKTGQKGEINLLTLYISFAIKTLKKIGQHPPPFLLDPPLFMKNLKSHLFAAFSRPYQPFK